MITGLSVMAVLAFTAYSQTYQDIEDAGLKRLDMRAEHADKVAGVSPIAVEAPLRRWTLLKKSELVCALRFTKFRHDVASNNKPRSWVWDSFYADYDWVYQADGSQDLTKSNVKVGHGQASRLPNWWRIERGDRFVACGAIKAQWWYPNSLYLINRNSNIPYDPKVSDQPNGVEIALTGWQRIEDVNAKEGRLVWYRYVPERDWALKDETKTIPVETLPGYQK